MTKVKVTETITKDLVRKIKELQQLPQEAHNEFIQLTPIDKGNARRNTSLKDKTITADYDYAQRLDQGWSKQAPRGMVEPWTRWVERRIKQIVEK